VEAGFAAGEGPTAEDAAVTGATGFAEGPVAEEGFVAGLLEAADGDAAADFAEGARAGEALVAFAEGALTGEARTGASVGAFLADSARFFSAADCCTAGSVAGSASASAFC
jgi:hypothetical protein